MDRAPVTAGAAVPLAPGAADAAGVVAGSGSVVAAGGDAPDRVSVVSTMLDIFSAGGEAFPGIVRGVVVTVVGSQQLPAPLDEVQAQGLAAFGDAAEQMSAAVPGGIGQFRSAVEPLSCQNEQINQGVTAFADGADAAMDAFGEFVQPLDLTTRQVADFARGMREDTPETC